MAHRGLCFRGFANAIGMPLSRSTSTITIVKSIVPEGIATPAPEMPASSAPTVGFEPVDYLRKR
jgi:hypothetical protein